MDTKARLISLAEYNIWGNAIIFRALEAIPEEILKQDRGVYFVSLFGTLNHLLFAQKLWLHRLIGTPKPKGITERFAETLGGLKAINSELQGQLLEFVKKVDKEGLRQEITFTSVPEGHTYVFTVENILFHLFNHQTQHKGQLTALIEQAGYNFEPIDYLLYVESQKT